MRGQCKGAVLAEVLVALLLLLPAASRVGATQHHHGLRDQLLLSTIEAAQAAADAAAPCEGISCFRQTIEADLGPLARAGGITRAGLAQAAPLGVRYQIINHHVYREERCIFVARCSGVEHFLSAVAARLPDVEFVLNVFDNPKARQRTPPAPVPVLSFSKTPAYSDIMYPAWTFWEGGPSVMPFEPRGLGRWDLKREALHQRMLQWPWEQKRKMGFFRGSRTSSERDPLVLLSRAKPSLVDAAYIKNQAFKSEKDLLGAPEANRVPLEDHCEYAYLFNFRGVAASFRHKHLFLCKSLVFHVGSEWLEFYYPAMKPWVHYVPVKADLSDAEELLEFFLHHDEEARRIAEAGFDFIWHNLRMEDVEEYWVELLTRYAELQNFAPTPDPALRPV